jgi:tetratricopeptide (TPR) repeat protein
VVALTLGGSIASVLYTKAASARERTFDSAIVAAQSGDFVNARQILNQVTASNPYNALAFYELGNADYMLGHKAEAIRSWTEAFRLDPNMAQAYIARGTHFYNEGKYVDSLRDFEQAVVLRPSTESFLQRGFALQALGRHEAALSDFDEALRRAEVADPIVRKARQRSLEALAKSK